MPRAASPASVLDPARGRTAAAALPAGAARAPEPAARRPDAGDDVGIRDGDLDRDGDREAGAIGGSEPLAARDRDGRGPAPAASRRPGPLDALRERERIARALRRQAPAAADEPAAPRGPLQAPCEALVGATPRLVLAWTWFGAADATLIEPEGLAGPAAAAAAALRLERSWITARGPVFRALEGVETWRGQVRPWSLRGPWRPLARSHGVRSLAVLPLRGEGDARRGVLALYADTEQYFEAVGEDLFRSMAELFSLLLVPPRPRSGRA
ncbi:hypothetical protein [Piscinibacter sakaiensis]|uniref:GAF domain-containing protein n=1 Tax=Piscinibacter sakaiensis TaxID=1547922 RepID=A0A0K8NX02_PISS1|nr:hypothetical protein [Piscinibacter sakaiensis]GAP34465.1 hypothetical protein ISF6_4640 [Piscinibacter sakaiensis]